MLFLPQQFTGVDDSQVKAYPKNYSQHTVVANYLSENAVARRFFFKSLITVHWAFRAFGFYSLTERVEKSFVSN